MAIACLAVLILRHGEVRVEGESMAPTICPGEHVWVNTWALPAPAGRKGWDRSTVVLLEGLGQNLSLIHI